jgi:NADPH-dependent 2,4-dienoyl-CoA reductase/sulfur reductase-like enzyme
VEEARKTGFDPAEVVIQSQSRGYKYPGTSVISVQLVGDRKSGRLLGAQMVGREGAVHRINAPAVALHAKMSVEAFGESDLAYAPPFGPSGILSRRPISWWKIGIEEHFTHQT